MDNDLNIHFTDAMLSIIFGGEIATAIFLFRSILKIDRRLYAVEIILKHIVDTEEMLKKSLSRGDRK